MKELKLETSLIIFDDYKELPEDIARLMDEAIAARKRAYAPYSNFQVGAAIALENGNVVTGNNQENASYPSGLCAERTAIYYAGSKFPGVKIKTMALSAGLNDGSTSIPIPPCGACRQAILEYEVKQQQPIEIYFMGLSGKVAKSHSLENLLPLAFDKSFL